MSMPKYTKIAKCATSILAQLELSSPARDGRGDGAPLGQVNVSNFGEGHMVGSPVDSNILFSTIEGWLVTGNEVASKDGDAEGNGIE
mmetsp:Transcript_46870/g.141985  ORF Transcript_46870/g.141985 Transcript_46870/m.141985 type:complete len:87 (+) Transcript_46870:236-496(+)